MVAASSATNQRVAVVVATTWLASFQGSPFFINGLQQPILPGGISNNKLPSSSSRIGRQSSLAVSQLENIDATSTIEEPLLDDSDVVLPYILARGDGMTGGGGLPMPKGMKDGDDANENIDEFRRPKVGAEMPKGRPAWFKVPAPSQGNLIEN